MIFSSLIILEFMLGGVDPIQNTIAKTNHPIMREVLMCESGMRQFDSNGTIITGAAGELGIAQFLPSTWKAMNEERGTNLDIRSPLAQINMMEWAFDRGYANQWVCYKNLTQ